MGSVCTLNLAGSNLKEGADDGRLDLEDNI